MSAAYTLVQKLIARAAGREQVTPGEIVNCRVDLAMFHDSSGPRRLKPMLDELGASIWDRNKVVLVMDNLNTHKPAALYQAFEPAVARALIGRLEIHHTPKHGSWLNMAEIELRIWPRTTSLDCACELRSFAG